MAHTSNDQERGNAPEKGKHEHRLRQEISHREHAQFEKAHEQAEKDIAADAELSAHSPNDDLDEGETARLGEENTDLI